MHLVVNGCDGKLSISRLRISACCEVENSQRNFQEAKLVLDTFGSFQHVGMSALFSVMI